jgi:hypothetical protein
MLLLAAVALVPASASAADNELPNGTFEGSGSGSLTGWTALNSRLSLDNELPHGGAWAAKVTTNAASQAGLRSAKIPVAKGTYLADGFFRGGRAGKQICLKIFEFASGGGQVGTPTTACTTSSGTTTPWTALPQARRTMTTGVSLRVEVIEKSAVSGDTFWVDNLSLGSDSPPPSAPAAPTNVAASATGPRSVQVSWTASSGATSYRVYRSDSQNGTYTELAPDVNAPTTSFTDSTALPETTYWYKVDAANTAGRSPQSAAASATTPADTPTAPPVPTGVQADGTSSTTVHVEWSASAGAVAYGVYRDGEKVGLDVLAPVTSFDDALLTPGTTYSYTVDAVGPGGARSAESAPDSATTDPIGGQTVTIAAAGDIACDPGSSRFNDTNGTSTQCRMRATSDLLLERNPSRVLPLGDLQYECGGLSAFQQSYDPTWGRLKGISKPIPGDNDYDNTTTQPGGTDCSPSHDAAGYYTYWGAQASGTAGDPAKGYYSYDFGGWHFVALNSNCAFVSCAAGSAQEVFLRNDLAANPECTIVYWHHPRFASGNSSGGVGPFFKAAYNGGAELVLSGHVHRYERFAPQTPTKVPDDAHGVRQFVVGTGGKSVSSQSVTPATNSEVRLSSYGVLELTLAATAYSWEFRTVGGGVADSGTTACHDKP